MSKFGIHLNSDMKIDYEARCGGRASRSLDTSAHRTIVWPMPMTPDELAREAMGLTTESRAQLADLLVESLDAAELSANDLAWGAEARRRRDEVRSGAVKPISADEVSRQVRDALKR